MTYRNRELLDLARGQDCRARIPNVCNGNPETVVSMHYPEALGTGLKQPDFRTAWGCSACHDFIDARTHKDTDRQMRLWYWNLAHLATLEYLFESGALTVTGSKVRELRPQKLAKIAPRNERPWPPRAA